MIKADNKNHGTALSFAERSQPLVLLPAPADEESTEDVLSLSHYSWLLRRNKWKIMLVVALCTGLTALYCFRVKPMYEATARITIDPRISSVAIGQDAEPAGASDIDQIMNTEMQIVQSDAVLRPVAAQFHLLVPAPDSKAVAVPAASRSVLQSATQWARRLGRREVSENDLIEAPVSLGDLSVVHPVNSLLLDISYRSGDPRLAALVANAVAQSYIMLGMETRARSSMSLSAFMEKQIAELKKNMDDSSLALAGYEQKLGVINPDEKTSMVAAHLLQLETEYTEAQNDRILKETQYRALESGASTATSAAALEVSPQAALLARQEDQVRAAEEKLAVAKTVYGPNYAEYKRAANDLAEVRSQYEQMRTQVGKRIQVSYQEAQNREQMLHASLLAAKADSDKLNANSAQYEELKREAEANKNLYNELFRKIKEAGVNAGFQGSSIRIANEARPPLHPVFPQKTLFLSIAFILSLLGSVTVVIVADMLDNTLRDPEQARRFTGCDVLATLPKVRYFPESRQSHTLESRSGDPKDVIRPAGKPLSAQQHFESEDFYRESISILLSTVLNTRNSAKPRSLLITSAGPGDGKSSCAAHLALASANLGKRTLLIDADLRIPFQHRFFKLGNEVGLGGAIATNLPMDAVRQHVDGAATLDVIVAGPATRYAVSQVGQRVAQFLQQSAREYDLVIVDAPPMVGLSDPVEIACATDGVLILGHAARTNRQAIATVMSTLRRVNANVLGVVLNHVRLDMSESYSQYSSYASYAGNLLS